MPQMPACIKTRRTQGGHKEDKAAGRGALSSVRSSQHADLQPGIPLLLAVLRLVLVAAAEHRLNLRSVKSIHGRRLGILSSVLVSGVVPCRSIMHSQFELIL